MKNKKIILSSILALGVLGGVVGLAHGHISAEAENRTIYLNAGGKNLWDQGGAWFVAWTWGSKSVADSWVTFTDSDGDGYYEGSVDSSKTGIKFLRMASGAKTPSWTQGDSGYWNNTDDLTLSADKNCYTITGWGGKDGSWSEYTPAQTIPAATEKVDLYFYNSNNWTGVNLYTWDETTYTKKQEYSGAWPGTAMTADASLGDNWYKASITVHNKTNFKFIFNSGSNQTSDLSYTEGKNYFNHIEHSYDNPADAKSEGDGLEKHDITVYYFNSNEWDKVNAYVWKGASETMNGAWPGNAATAVEGKSGWYSFTFNDYSASGYKAIFNDGTTQTQDILLSEDHLYYYGDGSQGYTSFEAIESICYFDTEKDLYFTPHTEWLSDDAWFAAYFFSGDHNAWVKLTDVNDNGVYECDVPEGNWSKVIFTRMDPAIQEPSWDAKWTQSVDLSPYADSNMFTITDAWGEGEEPKADGQWSVYEPHSENVFRLLSNYYNGGTYTRKTNIYFNDEALEDIATHFHGSVVRERTTYFTPEALWMTRGKEDSRLSYYGTSGENMTTGSATEVGVAPEKLGTVTKDHKDWDPNGKDENGMEGFYITLKDIMENISTAKWTYSNGVYSTTGLTEEFLAFTAPCLLDTQNYVQLAGVEIEEDTDGLHLRLLASGTNSGALKVAGVLSEAIITYEA